MEGHTVNNLPPAATDDDVVRCLLAIELSKKSWIIAVNTPLTDKISRHTLEACNWKRLVDLCERIRARVAKETGKRVEMVSCYEAGYDGFWLHRLLDEKGIRNFVIDPASLQVNRRARQAKTDRIDAERMLRAMMAYLRGEPKVWSVVRVPSVAEEDDRRLHRERDRLINERIQHVNRIKGLVAIHGIYDYQPMRGDRMNRLEELQTANGKPLPPRQKAELLRELRRLELVLETLKTIQAERDAIVAAKTESSKTKHGSAKAIQRLAKIKSIGPEFATILAGEVFYRSFDNRKQLASYVGLTPSPFESGASRRHQGISKAGNPKARSTMIELAWLWLRHQPDSALSAWFRERVGHLKGRIRRIMIVAVARKLLIALWRYLETGVVPTGAVLKA